MTVAEATYALVKAVCWFEQRDEMEEGEARSRYAGSFHLSGESSCPHLHQRTAVLHSSSMTAMQL
jgi:hypothetical protein